MAVQKAIGELIAGRMVIVVAHRLKTIKNADHIIVLDGGSVTEEGTHAELLDHHGLSHKLWTIQSQSIGWGI